MIDPNPERHLQQLTEFGAPFHADKSTLARLFGTDRELLPLWVAEPYLPASPVIQNALRQRAANGWYGYETTPPEAKQAFWDWMGRRHNWDGRGLKTTVSHSVGTSIGALIELFTRAGDGVIIQPPVFTEFKSLVTSASRQPIRNSLVLDNGRYEMNLADLDAKASDPRTTLLILCNPQNPVGRAWTQPELREVATICARHRVFVVADEIYADVLIGAHSFTPFAQAAADVDVRWAATHGPIKTFGLGGVADTVVVADARVTQQFRSLSNRLQLKRNNIFSSAATSAAYEAGDDWVDALIDLTAANLQLLDAGLPEGVRLIRAEATYLAWIDFRSLGMDPEQLARWLVESAALALSPGHWFGREGAGFARMTVAAPTTVIETAIDRFVEATATL